MFRYVGTYAAKAEAAKRAGKGGYIEPYDLTSEQGDEEGFPKSYQEFV